MDELTIEKNVPLPEKTGRGSGKWQRLSRRMAVGDSIVLTERQAICLKNAISRSGGNTTMRFTGEYRHMDDVGYDEKVMRLWLTEAVK